MFTKSDLTKKAKSYDYSVKFADGEIEAYPNNMRGEASFFELPTGDAGGSPWHEQAGGRRVVHG